MKRGQQGLGMISAIIVLVILASLAGAITTFGTTQQLTSAQDVMSVRAWQAAKAGNEWGKYMALRGGTGWDGGVACTPSATLGAAGATRTQTLDLMAEMGFSVAVSCSATRYNEGEDSPGAPRTVILYTISASANNGAPVASAAYVERNRTVIAEN